MSVNYAAGLSQYDNKGKCGLPEIVDDSSTLDCKIEQLVELMKECQRIVVHTGAGVSTAAGIPDFRGPKGVWTLEAKGQAPEFNVTFDAAIPTFTHMAIKTLECRNIVKYLVTQNVDGLHLRSGFPRDRMSELHGNMFVEQCVTCKHEHVRSTAVCSVGQKFTGNSCARDKYSNKGRKCRGKLRDTVLDWEANLPEYDLAMAEQQCKLADLSICLGSTLQIVPAGNLPVLTKKNGGRLVIVNLQPTKQDKHADLIIHAKVDDVMRIILNKLNIECDRFERPVINLQSANGPPEKLMCQKREKRNKNEQSGKRKKKRKNGKSHHSSSGSLDDNFDVDDEEKLADIVNNLKKFSEEKKTQSTNGKEETKGNKEYSDLKEETSDELDKKTIVSFDDAATNGHFSTEICTEPKQEDLKQKKEELQDVSTISDCFTELVAN